MNCSTSQYISVLLCGPSPLLSGFHQICMRHMTDMWTEWEVIEDLASTLLIDTRKKCTPQDNSYWNDGVCGVVSNSGGVEAKEVSEDWNG